MTQAESGEIIRWDPQDQPMVPDHPLIPYIEGDGIGPDIWAVTQAVLDAAID